MIHTFFKKPELLQLIALILREYVFCALIILVTILSIESILPGTTSLQMSMLFFIMSITGALLSERFILSHVTLPTQPKTTTRSHHAQKIRIVLFFLWSIFVLGNASLRFPLPIIMLLLLLILLTLGFFLSFFLRKKISQL